MISRQEKSPLEQLKLDLNGFISGKKSHTMEECLGIIITMDQLFQIIMLGGDIGGKLDIDLTNINAEHRGKEKKTREQIENDYQELVHLNCLILQEQDFLFQLKFMEELKMLKDKWKEKLEIQQNELNLIIEQLMQKLNIKSMLDSFETLNNKLQIILNNYKNACEKLYSAFIKVSDKITNEIVREIGQFSEFNFNGKVYVIDNYKELNAIFHAVFTAVKRGEIDIEHIKKCTEDKIYKMLADKMETNITAIKSFKDAVNYKNGVVNRLQEKIESNLSKEITIINKIKNDYIELKEPNNKTNLLIKEFDSNFHNIVIPDKVFNLSEILDTQPSNLHETNSPDQNNIQNRRNLH